MYRHLLPKQHNEAKKQKQIIHIYHDIQQMNATLI